MTQEKQPAEQEIVRLVHEPNSETIMGRALTEARLSAYANSNDPRGETGEINPLEFAPDLEAIILREINEYEMPEHLRSQLDGEEEYLALRALEKLPEEQRQRLAEAVSFGEDQEE